MTVTHEYELEERIECLQEQGFPYSLARYMCDHTQQTFPLRLWIVDNSGSMRETDGQCLMGSSTKSHITFQTCTRWSELTATVEYHAQMAALLHAPTQFMLLNPPPDNRPAQMGVAEMGSDMIEEELYSLRSTVQSITPGGVTPLTSHLHHVYALVSSIKDSLQTEGQRVVVVIATDGIPTDQLGYSSASVDCEFEAALQRLQELPVWIVVRLCTNNDRVVQYYQSLDDRLEWSLEVLDDFMGEAKEVYHHNPWLNYALCLHRCREWGVSVRLFDLLDERPLTRDEMSEFLQLTLCREHVYLSDPSMDWQDFVQRIQAIVKREERPWNPIQKKPTAWIDVKQLERCYGPRRFRQKSLLGILVGCVVLALGFLWWLWLSTAHHARHHHGAWNDRIAWIFGGGLLLVVALLRRPPNARLMLTGVGILLALALPALLDKPRSFFEGLGWMFGGVVSLFLIIAYNDR